MTIGTIWVSSECFRGYPLSALPETMLSSLQDRIGRTFLEADLLRLQCFSEVTGERLTDEHLHSGRTPEFLREFVAAHYSPRFITLSQPWVVVYRWKGAMEACYPEMPFPGFPCTLNSASWPSEFACSLARFASRQLAEDRVRFWQGWTAESSLGQPLYLNLWKFRLRYGEARTNELHAAVRLANSLQRAHSIPAINAFANWMAQYPTEIDFSDSVQIGRVVAAFFPDYFRSEHESGVRLSTLGCHWRQFARLMKNHLLGHAWAAPIPPMPLPRIPRTAARNQNIKRTANGEVKQGLLTPIPIHVSDADAKELLFRDVEREVDLLLAWARAEVQQARLRLERRQRLSLCGVVSEPTPPGKSSGLLYRLSPECPDRLAHAAATFQSTGFSHLGSGRPTALIYPRPIAETTWELGIPTPGLLLAHSTILVANQPAITGGFLGTLELYDRDGHQSGFQRADGGWYLIGAKPRRGARLAQQTFLLNQESARVIEDVVALTQPLREWLRAKDDDRWRRLFLAVPGLGHEPSHWDPVKHAHYLSSWLARRLTSVLTLSGREASDLASRFSLKRLRTSAALLVYLTTGSVQRMAEALGHEEWQPTLLDHYLPKPLQEFFTEHWIRIFQMGIVAEALKNSPHILEATAFESMAALDEFLENHALRRIPAHLQDPERIGREVPDEPSARVVVCVETGILTVLLSLEAAVRRATQLPCGRAIRWARIAERLVPHLETQTEQPEFRRIVAEAKRYANPDSVEALIYG